MIQRPAIPIRHGAGAQAADRVFTRFEHYRRIMKAIIASVKKGTRGIDAAHLTAGRAVELAFSWSLLYFAVLNLYRDTLRKMRQPPKDA